MRRLRVLLRSQVLHFASRNQCTSPEQSLPRKIRNFCHKKGHWTLMYCSSAVVCMWVVFLSLLVAQDVDSFAKGGGNADGIVDPFFNGVNNRVVQLVRQPRTVTRSNIVLRSVFATNHLHISSKSTLASLEGGLHFGSREMRGGKVDDMRDFLFR